MLRGFPRAPPKLPKPARTPKISGHPNWDPNPIELQRSARRVECPLHCPLLVFPFPSWFPDSGLVYSPLLLRLRHSTSSCLGLDLVCRLHKPLNFRNPKNPQPETLNSLNNNKPRNPGPLGPESLSFKLRDPRLGVEGCFGV